jgi:hypothetical protein
LEQVIPAEWAYRSAGEINSAMGRVYGHMSSGCDCVNDCELLGGHQSRVATILFYRCAKVDCDLCSTCVAIFGVSYVLGNNPSKGVAQLCLHGFAALMGLSFS